MGRSNRQITWMPLSEGASGGVVPEVHAALSTLAMPGRVPAEDSSCPRGEEQSPSRRSVAYLPETGHHDPALPNSFSTGARYPGQAVVLVTDGRMIVKVSGDIDARAARRFQNALDEALHPGAHRIDVDVEDMTSCCSSGLMALLCAHAHARQRDLLLRMIDTQGPWGISLVQGASVRDH
ncbi:STAS domain-containing protein [Streptomyces sp. NPDC055897]